MWNTSERGTRVLSICAGRGWTSAGSARLETPWRAGPTWSCRRRWATTAGLNVATSRAKCAVVLVASPKLFEPDCRTPRQMQRANAFCGYIELARLFGTAAMVLETDDGEPIRWLIVENASTEERRATGRPQLIDDHQAWAEKEAVDLGNRLRLPDVYVKMLATAASLHDEGKRTKRWQRAFNAKMDGCDYAKTRGPINFALLDGYRHEFRSPNPATNRCPLRIIHRARRAARGARPHAASRLLEAVPVLRAQVPVDVLNRLA